LKVPNLALLFEHIESPRIQVGIASGPVSFYGIRLGYKKKLVNSLLKRAYAIASSNKIVHEDFQRIKLYAHV